MVVEVFLPFHSPGVVLAIYEREKLSISEVVKANEAAFPSLPETMAQIDKIWQAMDLCIERGLKSEGALFGVLKVKRRQRISRCSAGFGRQR